MKSFKAGSNNLKSIGPLELHHSRRNFFLFHLIKIKISEIEYYLKLLPQVPNIQ